MIKTFKKLGLGVLFVIVGAASGSVFAQIPSNSVQQIYPLTRDLGCTAGQVTGCKLVTLTAQGTGTVNSADQTGYNVSRLVCVFNQTVAGGTPSTTFSIQFRDNASGQYYTVLTSAAVTTAVNTPSPIYVGNALTTAANVSANLMVPRTWRVSATVGGTTPAVTGTIGCTVE